MILTFELIEKREITEEHKKIFVDLLKKQNKVRGDLSTKIDKCFHLCIVKKNNLPIAMGAIKQKTKSVFSVQKANVPELEQKINKELGYLYTEHLEKGKGISSQIVKLLLSEYNDTNLMATTESIENPGMIKILKRNDFKIFGNDFKSEIHENKLCLFLKFK